MASMQQLRPPQQQSADIKLISSSTSVGSSINFVKRLTALSVSTITYLRNVFPDEAYGDKRLGGVALKVLKKDSGCGGAEDVVTKLGHVFDAIQQNYLRKLEMGIYKDDELLESYVFRVCNTRARIDAAKEANVPARDIHNGLPRWVCDIGINDEMSVEECEQQTTKLLRTMITACQGLRDLTFEPGSNYNVKMKLFLDDAPESFTLDGFSEAADAEQLKFESSPVKINVGTVATRHHALKFVVRTAQQNYDEKLHQALEGMVQDEELEEANDSQQYFAGESEDEEDEDHGMNGSDGDGDGDDADNSEGQDEASQEMDEASDMNLLPRLQTAPASNATLTAPASPLQVMHDEIENRVAAVDQAGAGADAGTSDVIGATAMEQDDVSSCASPALLDSGMSDNDKDEVTADEELLEMEKTAHTLPPLLSAATTAAAFDFDEPDHNFAGPSIKPKGTVSTATRSSTRASKSKNDAAAAAMAVAAEPKKRRIGRIRRPQGSKAKAKSGGTGRNRSKSSAAPLASSAAQKKAGIRRRATRARSSVMTTANIAIRNRKR